MRLNNPEPYAHEWVEISRFIGEMKRQRIRIVCFKFTEFQAIRFVMERFSPDRGELFLRSAKAGKAKIAGYPVKIVKDNRPCK